MDFLKYIYKTAVIGLPFTDYDLVVNKQFNELPVEDKIKEFEKKKLIRSHSNFIFLILANRPDLLSEEDNKFLATNRRLSTLLSSVTVLAIFSTFGFYLYNIAFKKKYYNKTFTLGNINIFLIYSLTSSFLEEKKHNKIYKKYSDVLPLEEYSKIKINNKNLKD